MSTSLLDAQNLGQRLRLALPVLHWAPQYQRRWLRPDFVAGLTLAAYAIPVSLAYASLAGLPGDGLYCYLLGGVAYAAFGTSRQMAVGPTSAISILIGASLGSMASGDTGRQMQLAMATAVLVAVMGVLAWLFRLGNVVNFHLRDRSQRLQSGRRACNNFHATPETVRIENGGQQFLQPYCGTSGTSWRDEPADSRHRSRGTRSSDFGRISFAPPASSAAGCGALDPVHVGDADGRTWSEDYRIDSSRTAALALAPRRVERSR